MSEFNISETLINFLEIFRGASISEDQAKAINSGILDLIIGHISTQNFTPLEDNNESYGEDNKKSKSLNKIQNQTTLSQVTIKTQEGKLFTLSDNKSFQLKASVLSTLGNIDLINRPEIIYIENLNKFREKFQDAARYSQLIACVYDRSIDSNEIIFFSIASPTNSQQIEGISSLDSKSSICGWPCRHGD